MTEEKDLGIPGERRFACRLCRRATVCVERLAAAYDDSQPADIAVCDSVDISTGGLQVRMDQPIPAGTILRLCAQLDDGEPLYMVGEVKWQNAAAQCYHIGFELFDSEQTDILTWRDSIARYLEER